LVVLLFGCDPPPPLSVDGTVNLGPAALFDAGALLDGVEVYADARTPRPDLALRYSDAACPVGNAVGTICSPNDDPIPGALVIAHTRSCTGAPMEVRATTDRNGFFRIEGLAPGPTEISVSSGSFVGEFAVEVVEDRDAVVAEQGSPKACLPTNAARLAVLTGNYDDIGAIIGELGFEFDVFCGTYEAHLSGRQLLHDAERLAQYDVVFINCATGIDLRVDLPEMTQIRRNLQNFVNAGGSLYVSDLAAGIIDTLWPDRIIFSATAPFPRPIACCDCVDCPPECLQSPPSSPSVRCPTANPLLAQCREPSGLTGQGRVGEKTGLLRSAVLREAVGRETLPITFELDKWMEIESVSPGVEVLVASEETRIEGMEEVTFLQPLMVRFRPNTNAGQVAYTSFHNHAQATGPMRAILRALVFSL